MEAGRSRPTDLPDFERPPLQEVAVGVQFDPILPFRHALVGDFWQRIQSSFPRSEDRPLLTPVLEGVEGPHQPEFELEFGPPPPNRAWFTSPDGSRLLQLQYDRLVLNLRRPDQGSPYRHFEPILADFEQYFTDFLGWAEGRELAVHPVQVEVNYVNGWEAADLRDHLRFAPAMTEAGLGRPERETWRTRHVIEDWEQAAAIYLDAERHEGRARFSLTARLRLPRAAWSDIEHALLHGRRRIVETFAASLSDQANDEWGRIT